MLQENRMHLSGNLRPTERAQRIKTEDKMQKPQKAAAKASRAPIFFKHMGTLSDKSIQKNGF